MGDSVTRKSQGLSRLLMGLLYPYLLHARCSCTSCSNRRLLAFDSSTYYTPGVVVLLVVTDVSLHLIVALAARQV